MLQLVKRPLVGIPWLLRTDGKADVFAWSPSCFESDRGQSDPVQSSIPQLRVGILGTLGSSKEGKNDVIYHFKWMYCCHDDSPVGHTPSSVGLEVVRLIFSSEVQGLSLQSSISTCSLSSHPSFLLGVRPRLWLQMLC